MRLEDQEGLRIQLSPLPEGSDQSGLSATLRIRRRGYAMTQDKKKTVVAQGRQVRVIPPGSEWRVAIPAHASALQRIVVDAHPLLVHVPAGSELSLLDDPCSGWTLTSSWLDPNQASAGDAYCTATSAPCREGFVAANRPRLADDPLCRVVAASAGESRRCVRQPRARFVGTPGKTVRLRGGADGGQDVPLGDLPHAEYRPVPMPACGYAILAAETETVYLAMGAGAKWTLRIDDGAAIQGSRD